MTDKRFVYQLVARGSLLAFDGPSETRSFTVFSTREAAERRIDKFRSAATDGGRVMALRDDQHLKIVVMPLEIVED